MVRFLNAQKVNEACNGSLIRRGVQKHGMKILLPLHNNGFDYLQEYKKKKTYKEGEEMLCTILYPDNSDKCRFADLKNCVENDYVLKKEEYPSTVTIVQSKIIITLI